MESAEAHSATPVATRRSKRSLAALKLTPSPSLLGARLREIRLSRGLTVRELAGRLELSASSVSQIERGKLQPSVRTLYALASEFGVTVDEVLYERSPLAGGTLGPAPLSPAAGAVASVQRATGRPSITLDSGVTWERLMLWADEDVEFIEATYHPGGASGPDDALVSHSGHEFGHVLSGTLRVVVGCDEYILEPGDSISFESSTPHRLSNDGSELARAMWVVRGRRGAGNGHEAA